MPDYDDGLVREVAKAIGASIPGRSPMTYESPATLIMARAAIAAVLEWQGKGTAADELRRAMEILNSPTPPATVEALRERLNRGLR